MKHSTNKQYGNIGKKLFFIVLCIGLFSNLFSQQADTIIPKKEIIEWKYNSSFTQRKRVEIDTMHLDFHNYSPNAIISDYNLDQGSFASPLFPLMYENLFEGTTYLHPFKNSLLVATDLLDYNTKQPFTDAFYSVSKNQEQQVKFFHTQNYNKDLNLGLKINYYKSLGEYTPQSITAKHFAPWISYAGPRFSTYFKFAYNSINHDDNGGILVDSIINSKNITTKMTHAKTEILYNNAVFIQKWNLSSASNYIDSSSIEIPQYPIALVYKINYESSKKYYTDTKIDYLNYTHVLWDSLKTNDTIKNKVITNEFYLESNKNSINSYYATNVGVGHEYENIYFRDYNYSYPELHNTSIYYVGNFLFNYKPQAIEFEHSQKYSFYGASKADFSLTTSLSKKFTINQTKKLTIDIVHQWNSCMPHALYSKFMSNHNMWDENFNKINNNHFSGIVNSDIANITMSLDYYVMNNYLYSDASGTISQANNTGKALIYSVKKKSEFWKINMQNGCVIQSHSIRGIDYPQWATYNSLAFHDILYKHLIDFNIGLEGLYYPKYFTPQYNTPMAMYTQQHTVKIGDYPIVNAFVAIKYKPIRILLKYNGLYSQFVEKNFLAAHYPQQTSYFTFAVSWIFYN